MNARLYDPKLHRFLATDNFIQDPGNSQNYNCYAYAFNNPLRYTDPSGEIVWMAVLVGAVIGAVSGAASYAAVAIQMGTWNWKQFGFSVLSGTVIGGVTGGILPMSVTSAGLASTAGASFVAGFMPSMNFAIGDWSFGISPSLAFGNAFGVGININAGYSDGNFSVSGGVGVMRYGNYHGFGKNGLEVRKSILAAYSNNGFGMSLGTNFWTGDYKQQTGMLGLRAFGINAMYENDGKPFSGWVGDGNDQHRSAALQLSYKNFSAGINLFTGQRDRKSYELENSGEWDDVIGEIGNPCHGIYGEYYKNGLVAEVGPKYRLGALYAGYKNLRIGTNSEWVRHYIQNLKIHGSYFAAQRMFEMQSDNWGGYLQYKTSNKFTIW